MIARAFRALIAGSLLAVAVAAPAVAAEGLVIETIDTTNLPTISIEVTLPASMAGRVPDADDFAVLVDGVRPLVEVYAGVVEPLDIVLLLDTSGSMAGAPIERAREAATAFVAAMPANAAITVIAFGDTAAIVAGPDDDAIDAISSLKAAGETALYDAVSLGSGAFADGASRRVMLVLSDGGDTVSTTTLQEATVAASYSEADVRAVALASAEADPSALTAIASDAVITADDASDLADVYAGFASQLTGTYRLEFETNATGPTEIHVLIDIGVGVETASAVIDIPEPSAATSARPGSPAAPLLDPSVLAVTVTPTTLERGWTLPAGILLVFIGALISLWLTLRGREETLMPLVEQEPEDEGQGPLRRMAGRLRSVGDRIAERSAAGSIDAALDRAGIALRPGEFVVVSGTAIIVLALVGLTLGGVFGAVVLGSFGAAAPRTVLKTLTERRRRRFAEQLEGTLQIVAGSLRAGYGLTQAVSTVATESASPTAAEFNRVVVENRLGRSVEQAMGAMAKRMENEDLGWVVEAIEIQHEVGGNLAEVLDTVMTTIRERNQIRRQVKALSAEGRISAYILLSLPFIIAGFIATISPEYLAELTDTTTGRVMLGAAAVMMAAGSAWIRRIIKVDF